MFLTSVKLSYICPNIPSGWLHLSRGARQAGDAQHTLGEQRFGDATLRFQKNLINKFCFENETSSELFSLLPYDAYDTVITYNTIWYHMVAYSIPAYSFVLLFHFLATSLHDGGHTPVAKFYLILGQLQQSLGADQQLAYWHND